MHKFSLIFFICFSTHASASWRDYLPCFQHYFQNQNHAGDLRMIIVVQPILSTRPTQSNIMMRHIPTFNQYGQPITSHRVIHVTAEPDTNVSTVPLNLPNHNGLPYSTCFPNIH